MPAYFGICQHILIIIGRSGAALILLLILALASSVTAQEAHYHSKTPTHCTPLIVYHKMAMSTNLRVTNSTSASGNQINLVLKHTATNSLDQTNKTKQASSSALPYSLWFWTKLLLMSTIVISVLTALLKCPRSPSGSQGALSITLEDEPEEELTEDESDEETNEDELLFYHLHPHILKAALTQAKEGLISGAEQLQQIKSILDQPWNPKWGSNLVSKMPPGYSDQVSKNRLLHYKFAGQVNWYTYLSKRLQDKQLQCDLVSPATQPQSWSQGDQASEWR